MSGFTSEAEGYAASLRQQAAWIEESPAAEMIDADELRAAANFIERQQGIIASAQGAPIPEGEAILRLSANEYACYRWPTDTVEHRAMRAAYMDGAASTFRAPEAEAVVPDERGVVS